MSYSDSGRWAHGRSRLGRIVTADEGRTGAAGRVALTTDEGAAGPQGGRSNRDSRRGAHGRSRSRRIDSGHGGSINLVERRQMISQNP